MYIIYAKHRQNMPFSSCICSCIAQTGIFWKHTVDRKVSLCLICRVIEYISFQPLVNRSTFWVSRQKYRLWTESFGTFHVHVLRAFVDYNQHPDTLPRYSRFLARDFMRFPPSVLNTFWHVQFQWTNFHTVNAG